MQKEVRNEEVAVIDEIQVIEDVSLMPGAPIRQARRGGGLIKSRLMKGGVGPLRRSIRRARVPSPLPISRMRSQGLSRRGSRLRIQR